MEAGEPHSQEVEYRPLQPPKVPACAPRPHAYLPHPHPGRAQPKGKSSRGPALFSVLEVCPLL